LERTLVSEDSTKSQATYFTKKAAAKISPKYFSGNDAPLKPVRFEAGQI